MNHSKRGLNEPFYKWLDDVRRAIRKEKELQEKLQYYNVKLIGYKGVVYDRIGSSSTSPNEKDIFFWIDKISIVERQIIEVSSIIDEYQKFLSCLNSDEKEVLSLLITTSIPTSEGTKMTRSYRYQIINKVVINWNKLKSTDKQG